MSFAVNIVPYSSRVYIYEYIIVMMMMMMMMMMMDDDDDFIFQHCFMSHTFYEKSITFY